MSEFKGTKVFPKYEGGDNYSVDLIFENEATISIDRRSRYTEQCNMSREEMEANALLISKAPEMLEMLIELREIFDKYRVDNEQQFSKYKQPLEKLIKEATTI